MSGWTLHVHVGLPKTASTWLQRDVFPRMTHLRVSTTPRSAMFAMPADAAQEHRVAACVVRRDAAIWRSEGGAIFEAILGSRAAWLARGGDALVSDESFGRAGSRPALLAAHLAGMAEAGRAWGFARLRVVMLVRRQDQWLASHYAQISDRRPEAGQADFERFVAGVLDPARERYLLGQLLDYAGLVDAMRRALGEDAVTVLAHEALASDRAPALGRLGAALGGPAVVPDATAANVRSDGSRWTLRPPRGGVRGLLGRAGLGRARRITLPPDLGRRVLASYADSNAWLAAAAGLDLSRHGYDPDW